MPPESLNPTPPSEDAAVMPPSYSAYDSPDLVKTPTFSESEFRRSIIATCWHIGYVGGRFKHYMPSVIHGKAELMRREPYGTPEELIKDLNKASVREYCHIDDTVSSEDAETIRSGLEEMFQFI